ncbi:hypothetical protein P8452_48224 [Trifolium repens]|nr:hypothetical protein P8452_48224 [Trifolium repens]
MIEVVVLLLLSLTLFYYQTLAALCRRRVLFFLLRFSSISLLVLHTAARWNIFEVACENRCKVCNKFHDQRKKEDIVFEFL